MDRRHLLKKSMALGGLVGLGALKAERAAAQGAPSMDPPALIPAISARRAARPRGSNEVPYRAQADQAVRVMEELFSRFPAKPI